MIPMRLITVRLFRNGPPFAVASLALFLSGCFVLVPLAEPDAQALAGGKCLSCRRQAAEQDARSYYPRTNRLGAPREGRVAKLLRQLESPRAVNRAHAAYWLGELGTDATAAVPGLITHLSDNDKWVRRAAAKALGKIGDSRAKEPLKVAGRDRDHFVAESARKALNRFR